MRIFAKFDETGRRIATYTDDIYPEDAIPADAVEITEAQWRELVDNPETRRWIGGEVVVYEPPTPKPTVPASVFDYQFAGAAEARGIITPDECDAWVGPGAVPETLLSKVEQLIPDPDTQRRVVLFLKGSKEFPRFHPNTVALARLFGLDTDSKLDDFFIAAAQR